MDYFRRDFLKKTSILLAAAPFASCISGHKDPSKKNNVGQNQKLFVDSKQSITSLASFALQFLTGMDLPFLGSDNSENDFEELKKRLDSISTTLDQITGQLDEVITMLKNLPEVIRGVFNEEFIRGAVSRQGNSVMDLLPYLRDRDMFLASGNLNHIQQSVFALSEATNEILDRTGGNSAASMTGFCMSCSGIAIWAQAKTILLNMKELNPNHQTIWDQNFFQKVVDLIKRLFAGVEQTDRAFKTEISNIPGSDESIWEMARWGFVNGNFKRLTIHDQMVINQFKTDKWKGISDPPKPWDQCGLFSSIKHRPSTNPTFPDPGGFNFRSTERPEDFEDPATIRKANTLWNNYIMPHIKEIEMFYETFKDYPNIKDAIYQKLVKPGSAGNSVLPLFFQ